MKMTKKEEKLKELKEKKKLIEEEIKKLESGDISAGSAKFRTKKNGMFSVSWSMVDERGTIHNPEVAVGFTRSHVAELIGHMIGDMTLLKEEIEEDMQ